MKFSVGFPRRVFVLGGTALWIIAFIVESSSRPAWAQGCVGDCDGSGQVTVDELVSMVNIALGSLPVTNCPAGDANNDNQVTVDEIVTAVGNALNGCRNLTTTTPTSSSASTPTRTPTSTQTQTHTNTPTPDLEIAVEVNPDPAVAGETLRVAITVANRGPFPVSDVVVRALVPPEVDAFSASIVSNGPRCNFIGGSVTCDRNETIVWNLGTLGAGDGVTLTFQPLVSTGITAGTPINFTANVGTSISPTDFADATVIVEATAPLKLALTEDHEPIASGEEQTYTLAFGYTATAATAPSTTLRMPIPGGTTFVAASDGGQLTGNAVEWPIGTLQPGQSGKRTLTVVANGNLVEGSLIEAHATIDHIGPAPNEARAAADTRVQSDQPLSVAIEVNPDPAAATQTLQIALTIANAGDMDLSDVVVTLRMPSELDVLQSSLVSGDAVCNSFGGSVSCDSRELIRWNVGALASGNGITFTLPPTVRTGIVAGSAIVFDVAVRDASERRAGAARSILVMPTPALELALTEDEEPVSPGGDLTYTLTFGHIATAANALNTTLQMHIPRNTLFVSASHGGALAGDVVEWPLGTLEPGDSGQRSLTVAVDADLPDGSLIDAQASITDANTLPDQSRAEAITRVQTDLPLLLSLEINPDPAAPGQPLRIAVTATNTTDFNMSGVVVTLRMPRDLKTLAAATASGAACNLFGVSTNCDPTELIIWNVGVLGGGNGITLTLPPVVRGSLDSGNTITFDAAVSDSTGRRAAASRAIVAKPQPPLELVLTEDGEPVGAEDDLNYTLAYGHVATAAVAPDTTLRMPIPRGTSFVAASDGGTMVDGVVEWALGTLAPGQSGKRSLKVSVDSDVIDGSLIEAQASIAAAGASQIQARALAVTRVQAALPLLLSMEANPDPAAPQEILRIAITATNTTAFDMTGVVVALRMPTELDAFAAALISSGALCNAFGVSVNCDPTEQIVWNVGTIGAGNGITLTLPPQVNQFQRSGTTIALEATARDATNRRAAVRRSLLVQTAPPLDLALTKDSDPTAPLGTVTYTLAFGHVATAAVAPNAILRMPIPAGTSLVQAPGGNLVDGGVEWPLGTLQPGQGGERTLTVSVDADAADGALIDAEARITDSKVVPDQSRASTVTRVRSEQPLLLAIEVNPDPAAQSETMQVGITVTNTSAFDLPGVVVTMRAPVEIASFPAVLASGGALCNAFSVSVNCDPPELIVWSIGVLGGGQGITLTLPPALDAILPSGNTVVFEAAAFEGGGDRAAATSSVVVQTAPVLDLVLIDDGEPVAPGSGLIYTLAFGNTSASTTALSPLLSASIPPGTTFVAASDGGTVVGDRVEWPFATLQPHQSGTRSLTVEVDSNLLDGSIIAAEAAIVDTSAIPHERRAMADTRVEETSPIVVTFTINPDLVAPGGGLVGMLTATNTTAFNLTGVVVTLRMPVELNSLAAAAVSGGALCNAFAVSVNCDPPELIVWNVGMINASSQVTFMLPPTVRAAIPAGTAIRFDALAITGDKSNSSAPGVVLVGP